MLCVTRNRFDAGLRGRFVYRARFRTTSRRYSSPAFKLVPTAVAPMFSSSSCSDACRTSSAPRRTQSAYPLNSCPRVIGTASCRCVRPVFRTSAQDFIGGVEDGGSDVPVQPPQRGIGFGRGLLHEDGRDHEIRGRPQAADGEVLDGALGLHPVVRVGGNRELTKRVAFSAEGH